MVSLINGFNFILYKFINNLKHKKMRTSKLLAFLAVISVVLIAGCNKNESWLNGPDSGNSALMPLKSAVVEAVPLGLAGNFAILSKSGITDVPPSVITGNIGTSPITGAAITGVTCPEVTGTIYTVDNYGPPCRVIDATMLGLAVLDMETAYNTAYGMPVTSAATTDVGAGILTDLTLAAGVYHWGSTLNIPTDLTLNGSATDVWIFQVAGTLDIATGKKVILTGGALAQNVYWQVSGAVTLGTYSHFEGTILAKTNIAMQTGASINGRLLAQTAVTLDHNTITVSGSSSGGTKPPSPCRDFVTGGGWIKGNSDARGHKNDKATFGVSGGMKDGKFWGQLSYNDHGKNGVSVKSTSVTAYIVIDSVTRQIEGTARVNGRGPFDYTVVVKDNGERGRNDFFSLVLSNGYDYNASGTLEGGNIQLHKECGESHNKHDKWDKRDKHDNGDKEDYYDKDENDGHKNCDKDHD